MPVAETLADLWSVSKTESQSSQVSSAGDSNAVFRISLPCTLTLADTRTGSQRRSASQPAATEMIWQTYLESKVMVSGFVTTTTSVLGLAKTDTPPVPSQDARTSNGRLSRQPCEKTRDVTDATSMSALSKHRAHHQLPNLTAPSTEIPNLAS